MSRLRWPDSTNSVSEKPGTIQTGARPSRRTGRRCTGTHLCSWCPDAGPGRLRLRPVGVDRHVLIEREGRVDTVGLVRPGAVCEGGAVGDDRADAAPAEQIALDARDREVRRHRAAHRLVVGLDSDQAQADLADTTGQPPPRNDRHLRTVVEPDLPAVEQDRRVGRTSTRTATAGTAEDEGPLVLEEELPLLGEEQAEASEVDLLLIGFDLREVGIDREVGPSGSP